MTKSTFKSPQVMEGEYQEILKDWKTTEESLVFFIRSVSDSFVLALNGAWGTGKTTFLTAFKEKLATENIADVIYFNAWESDYIQDSKIALLGELSEYLDRSKHATSPASKKFKKKLKDVAVRSIPAIIRIGTSGFVNLENDSVEKLLEKEIGQLLGSTFEDEVKAYTKAKRSLLGIKDATKEVASQNERPFVFIVDELDRCRPDYAVAVLETIKHFFDIPNIIFILGVDLGQLKHSISTLYGQGMNSEGYLTRFIDLEYEFRSPNQRDLHWKLVGKYELANLGLGNFYSPLDFFDLTPRDLHKILTQIKIMSKVLAQWHVMDNYLIVAIFLLALKRKFPELYRKFCDGDICPGDLLEEIGCVKKNAPNTDAGDILVRIESAMWGFYSSNPLQAMLKHYRRTPGTTEKHPRQKIIEDNYPARSDTLGFQTLINAIEISDNFRSPL